MEDDVNGSLGSALSISLTPKPGVSLEESLGGGILSVPGNQVLRSLLDPQPPQDGGQVAIISYSRKESKSPDALRDVYAILSVVRSHLLLFSIPAMVAILAAAEDAKGQSAHVIKHASAIYVRTHGKEGVVVLKLTRGKAGDPWTISIPLEDDQISNGAVFLG